MTALIKDLMTVLNSPRPGVILETLRALTAVCNIRTRALTHAHTHTYTCTCTHCIKSLIFYIFFLSILPTAEDKEEVSVRVSSYCAITHTITLTFTHTHSIINFHHLHPTYKLCSISPQQPSIRRRCAPPEVSSHSWSSCWVPYVYICVSVCFVYVCMFDYHITGAFLVWVWGESVWLWASEIVRIYSLFYVF